MSPKNVTVEYADDIISLDLTSLEIPPAGRYFVRVASAKRMAAKSSGNPMLSISMVIVEPEEYAGAVIYDNLMLSGPGVGRTKAMFDALGLPYDGVSTADIVGGELWVQTEVEDSPQFGRRVRVRNYLVG